MELRNVVLVDGARSAFARGGRGKLVATRLDETAATVLRALMERNPKVKPGMVEDIGLGNVLGVAEFAGGIGANVAGHATQLDIPTGPLVLFLRKFVIAVGGSHGTQKRSAG